jgi:hypothetical protein
MRVCARSALVCILPLGVALNSVGKRRLIWDGRHVNRNLRKRKFKMETLQRKGRSLFERATTAEPQLFPALTLTSRWPSQHTLSSVSSGKAFFTASKCSLSEVLSPFRPLFGPVVIHHDHEPLHPLHPLDGWRRHSLPRRLYLRWNYGPRDRDVGPAYVRHPARVWMADTPNRVCRRHVLNTPDVRRLGHARRPRGAHLRCAARPDHGTPHGSVSVTSPVSRDCSLPLGWPLGSPLAFARGRWIWS